MTVIYLVRHGESYASRVPQTLGTDFDLTENGVSDAEYLAEFFKDVNVDVVYTSKLKRSIRTAEIICKHHKNVGFLSVCELNERNYGDFDGMLMEDFKKEYPDLFKEKIRDPYNCRYHGGENLVDVAKRLKPKLNCILKENEGKTILIVAHNHVNKVLLKELLGLKESEISSVPLQHRLVYKIIINKGKISLFYYCPSGEGEGILTL